MENTALSDALAGLRTGSKGRSNTAKLRDVIGDVEAAIGAGVPRAEILEVLKEQGIVFSLKAFDTALYRIRQERRNPRSAAYAPGHTESHSPNLPPGLTAREQQERLADYYKESESENPLAKRLLKP